MIWEDRMSAFLPDVILEAARRAAVLIRTGDARYLRTPPKRLQLPEHLMSDAHDREDQNSHDANVRQTAG